MGARATKCSSRLMSLLLAFCILLGSFTVVTGLRVTPGPAHPEISLDVCHPLQTPNLVASVLIARPAAGLSEPVIYSQGSIAERSAARLTEYAFAPDPPPPKALV
jgi:hypothetical protein